jgi:hypothetical protein
MSSWLQNCQLLAWFLIVTSDALAVTTAPVSLPSSSRFVNSRQTYFTGFDVDAEISQFGGRRKREIFDSSRDSQQIVSRKERIKQRQLTGLYLYSILMQNMALSANAKVGRVNEPKSCVS